MSPPQKQDIKILPKSIIFDKHHNKKSIHRIQTIEKKNENQCNTHTFIIPPAYYSDDKIFNGRSILYILNAYISQHI